MGIDLSADSIAAFLESEPAGGDREDFQTVITRREQPLTSGLESMPDKLYRKYCEKHYALIAQIDTIGLPAPGEQFRLVTRRSFNAVQFIEFVAARERIEDLRLVVYSIKFQAAEKIIALLDAGKIGTAEILVSNLRNGAHREKERVMRELFTAHPKIRLFYCSSHAKIASCKTDNGNYYTIEGSGNMTDNSRVEQYVIDNDRALYQFTVDWMTEIKQYLKGKREYQQCEGPDV